MGMHRFQAAADVAAMTAALAREAPRQALFRLACASSARVIPCSAASLSAEQLTATLSSAHPGVSVRATRAVDAHGGTTDRARIAVEYERPGDGPTPPPSVFVKASPAGAASRVFVNLMQLAANEVRFYREIAASVPVPVPRSWRAERRAATGAFVLVLEDLAARGARFTDVSDRADLATARTVVTALGRLHAAFWASARFERELAWLRTPGPRPGLRLERCLCRSLAGRGVARFPDVIPEQIRASAGRLVAARDHLERAWADGPMTLLHGDCHVGNMYFVDGGVGLLDWQVAQRGQGMRDVSYFLVNSVPTDTRRRHERELIELWRSVLDDRGVRPPSFETAWRQHRLHAIYTWIGTTVTAAVPRLQPAPIARAGLSRACRALVDLGSLDALDDIGA